MRSALLLRVLSLAVLFSLCTGTFVHSRDIVYGDLGMVDFYISARPNYDGAQWVFDQDTDKLIGYAPWDPVNRRWLLFSLEGTYEGFIQATIGDLNPPHYTQYLWYDRENRYRGLFVTRLGGRPESPTLPDGELGGELIYYPLGDIQTTPPLYQKEVHPLRELMHGIEAEPIDPLYNK